MDKTTKNGSFPPHPRPRGPPLGGVNSPWVRQKQDIVVSFFLIKVLKLVPMPF